LRARYGGAEKAKNLFQLIAIFLEVLASEERPDAEVAVASELLETALDSNSDPPTSLWIDPIVREPFIFEPGIQKRTYPFMRPSTAEL